MPEHRRMKRTLLLLAVAALSAASVAACGSSSGSPAASTGRPPPRARAREHRHERHRSDRHDHLATTSAATTARPRRLRVRVRRAAVPAATLSLSFLGQQGGMGHGEIGFVLKNTGSVACRTYGWPGILFLGQTGNPLPTIPHHTPTISSAPARRAARDRAWSERLVPARCRPRGRDLHRVRDRVRAPGDPAERHRDASRAIPNGAYECQDANVSPLRSGDTAYP